MVKTFPHRLASELPQGDFILKSHEKAMLFFADRGEIFVLFDGLWHLKIRIPFDNGAQLSARGTEIAVESSRKTEFFSLVPDPVDNEIYFLRRLVCRRFP